MELRITEGEKASVAPDKPVTAAVKGRRNCHYVPSLHPQVREVPVRAGSSKGSDRTVGGHQPIALPRRRAGDPHHRSGRS